MKMRSSNYLSTIDGVRPHLPQS